MDETPTAQTVIHSPVTLPGALASDPAVAALELRMTGPAESEGPLPLLIYLALSSEDSLALDPFNQPVAFLAESPVRVVSMTLPGHGPGQDKLQAMSYWVEQMQAGNDLLTGFIEAAQRAVRGLIEKGVAVPGTIGLAGLSRGAFIGLHLAAAIEEISVVCGFAPLTSFAHMDAFASIANSPDYAHLHLATKAPALAGKTIRLYIGNKDSRVSTGACYQLTEQLVDAAFAAGHRSPPVELQVYPSIGHKGHGTPEHIFRSGARWLEQQLVADADRK